METKCKLFPIRKDLDKDIQEWINTVHTRWRFHSSYKVNSDYVIVFLVSE